MMPIIYKTIGDDSIINLLKSIGLKCPTISYTPLVMFNAPHLFGKKYNTPPHQDWRSMQGSLDSMVLWAPLQNITDGFGNIEFIPGSHREGLYNTKKNNWYREIDETKLKHRKFKSVPINKCDLLIFSSFLIHKTGINNKKKVRWSTQFRYNNAFEKTYIKRNYVSPYINKPIQELFTKNFPNINKLNKIFGSSEKIGK